MVTPNAIELLDWITTGRARELREGAGLSQADAARACEVTPAAILRWERGDRRPRGRNVAAYHRFLKSLARRVATASARLPAQ